jgi:hypothetical protein
MGNIGLAVVCDLHMSLSNAQAMYRRIIMYNGPGYAYMAGGFWDFI